MIASSKNKQIICLACLLPLLWALYWFTGYLNSDQTHQLSNADSKIGSSKHTNRVGDFDRFVQDSLPTYAAAFPRQTWQTSSIEARKTYAQQSGTWQKLEGFKYNYLSDDAATEFVHTHFKDGGSIVKLWDDLSIPVLRADLLRYLIMLVKGGIYSDIDTSCLQHPDTWIPAGFDAAQINAVIGIEYDDNTYPIFVRPISFSQWTLMSKPQHPIFQYAVQRMMSNLEFLARRARVEIANLKPQKKDIIQATGPGMITDVVMQVLRDQGQNVTWQTFHNMKEPTMFGDVLILPVNGFCASQKHSHAGDPNYGEKLVQHHFAKSWYEHKPSAHKSSEPKRRWS